MGIIEVMAHTLRVTIEVGQMPTRMIIIRTPAQAIQMAMVITIVIILHHMIIHQIGIHQATMITIMIMDTTMTMGMIINE